MQITEEFGDLSPGAMVLVGVAVLFSLCGTLLGLGGLFMWGIIAFESLGSGAVDLAAMFRFAMTVVIAAFGILNLMLAMRWEAFLTGGWRRWLIQSAISVMAAALFVWNPLAV